MRFVWHSHIQSFLDKTLVHLEKEEALNNLMLGIALRLKQDPGRYPDVVMITVQDGNELALAALMTPPEKLMVYSPRGIQVEALEYMIQGLLARSISIPGVIGPAQLAKQFADLWIKQTGSNAKPDMHLRVYELRKVNLEVIGEGRLRVAQETDLEFIVESIVQFQSDIGVKEPDLESCTKIAKRYIANRSLFLWEHQQKVVSMAGAVRPTLSGVAVNLVYTPKELRRRGYATSCVAALSQRLLESGHQFCTLFADLANPISNSIYQKIGYKPIGDYDSYLFA
ncbi:MAG TPA: GNAT family N-acetyltransferase [Firmicutes bacterium]|nr:GNAT family N-acetyltransferase [Bacillota bacterium]